MVVIYVAVSCGVFFAAWTVRATLRKLQFEAYDRHLGMVLGGLEGGLLGIIATLFVVSLAPTSRGPIFESPTGRLVGIIMHNLGPVLPTEARTVLKPFWNGESAVATTTDGVPGRPSKPAPAASDDLATKIEKDLMREVEANVRSRTVERR